MSGGACGAATTRRWLLAALILSAASLASLGGRAEAVNAPGGLAASGYDVVAYFTLGKAARGSPQFTQAFQGVTYRFASAANRDLFAADPARYLPAYGGYSAYGVASGRLVAPNPEVFTIHEGRLYLDASREMRSLWLRDPALYIARANEAWLGLR